MTVNQQEFARAMQAALKGPEQRVQIQTRRFNVKPVLITKQAGGIFINGRRGHHLSRHRRFLPNDRFYYSCRVTAEGSVENLEVSVRTMAARLGAWFRAIRDVLEELLKDRKADDMRVVPVEETLSLLDGTMEGEARFLIANIIVFAAREHLDVAVSPAPISPGQARPPLPHPPFRPSAAH